MGSQVVSAFKRGQCRCGSTHLEQQTMKISGAVRKGTEGFVCCTECLYWERLMTVANVDNVFATSVWVVLEAGQGAFRNDVEREATIIYRNENIYSYK